MPKQIYNLVAKQNSIEVIKNENLIYEIHLTNKSIDLNTLYNSMEVKIDDELEFCNTTTKVEVPKSDSERIFNNTYDFINNLIESLNKKINELKKQDDKSVFQ